MTPEGDYVDFQNEDNRNPEEKPAQKSIEIVGGVEDPHTDEGIRHVTEEPGSETETTASEEKSTAEEIVDESKSE